MLPYPYFTLLSCTHPLSRILSVASPYFYCLFSRVFLVSECACTLNFTFLCNSFPRSSCVSTPHFYMGPFGVCFDCSALQYCTVSQILCFCAELEHVFVISTTVLLLPPFISCAVRPRNGHSLLLLRSLNTFVLSLMPPSQQKKTKQINKQHTITTFVC